LSDDENRLTANFELLDTNKTNRYLEENQVSIRITSMFLSKDFLTSEIDEEIIAKIGNQYKDKEQLRVPCLIEKQLKEQLGILVSVRPNLLNSIEYIICFPDQESLTLFKIAYEGQEFSYNQP